MPVPVVDVPYCTVTVLPLGASRVTVKVIATLVSASTSLEVSKEIIGSGSSSIMVPVASRSEEATVALDGLESRTVKVSLNSSKVSSIRLTVKVLLVSPSANVRVPDAAA